MTDGKKPSQRKKVPTLQELDDMQEDGTPDPAGSSKGRPAGSKKKRNPIRVREGVGQNKKVAKAPSTRPEPKPASKPEKVETAAKQSDSSSSPHVSLPPSVPPQPSEYPTHDEYACAMARYESEKQGHQMGQFKEFPNDGGRGRTYKSKCVICDQRAIALVAYLEGYSDAMGQPRWHGDATKRPCLSRPRSTTKTVAEKKAQLKPKPGKQKKLPASFEVPLPSWDGILEAIAQDEARRAANDKDRRHRVKGLFPLAYPEAGKDSIYQGKCERCRRKVFGKVQRFPGDPGKPERILVYGNALQHPCSGSRVKR